MTASLCWARPKGGAWVLAERTESGDVILPDGRTLDTLETAAHNVSHTLNLDDPTYMDDLHEAPLLDLLRRRFQQGTIYTWAGPDVLLSVNPFRTIPRLYDLPDGWRRAATAAAERKSSSTPPHVFSVAERAWRSVLSAAGTPQALVCNGESGAGKTEACRQMLRFIAHASADCRAVSAAAGGAKEEASKLEDAVLNTTCVLEAFGNARTKHNHNSSRFGKLTCLGVTPHGKGGVVSSCSFRTLLLERSRVAGQAAGERSFHVFYWLLEARGLDPDSYAMLGGTARSPAPPAATEAADTIYAASEEEAEGEAAEGRPEMDAKLAGGAEGEAAESEAAPGDTIADDPIAGGTDDGEVKTEAGEAAPSSELAVVEAALAALGFSAADVAGMWSTLLGLLELIESSYGCTRMDH